jgi:thioesterase domain-containing protein
VKRYDPLQPPDPKKWLALDEAERSALAEKYHRQAGIKLPRLKAHATIHAIVENQVAMGDEIPVRRTLERLQREGLDRHDAIHAVAWVLVLHLHDALNQALPPGNPHAAYYAELEKLTAEKWLHSADEPDE